MALHWSDVSTRVRHLWVNTTARGWKRDQSRAIGQHPPQPGEHGSDDMDAACWGAGPGCQTLCCFPWPQRYQHLCACAVSWGHTGRCAVGRLPTGQQSNQDQPITRVATTPKQGRGLRPALGLSPKLKSIPPVLLSQCHQVILESGPLLNTPWLASTEANSCAFTQPPHFQAQANELHCCSSSGFYSSFALLLALPGDAFSSEYFTNKHSYTQYSWELKEAWRGNACGERSSCVRAMPWPHTPLLLFWLHCATCRILLPDQGPTRTAVKAQSLNHWPAGGPVSCVHV